MSLGLQPPIVPLPVVTPEKSFGFVRSNGKTHNGTDYTAPDGTPLLAASDGVVSFVFSADTAADGDEASGNALGVSTTIDGKRVTWSYSHMQRILVRPGERVARGQLVGFVGHTGTVRPEGPAGAHLHMTLKIDGAPADPARNIGAPSSGGLLSVGLGALGFAVGGFPGALLGAGVGAVLRAGGEAPPPMRGGGRARARAAGLFGPPTEEERADELLAFPTDPTSIFGTTGKVRSFDVSTMRFPLTVEVRAKNFLLNPLHTPSVGLAWDGATLREHAAVTIPGGTTAVFTVSAPRGRFLEVWSNATGEIEDVLLSTPQQSQKRQEKAAEEAGEIPDNLVVGGVVAAIGVATVFALSRRI